MLKIKVKRIMLIILAFWGYILLLPLWRRCRKDFILVLRYHSVSDFRRHEVNVKIRQFNRQIRYLIRSCNVISLDEFLSFLKQQRRLPERAVLVTFDDGYKDNFTNAYPLLKKFALPATIFLPTAYIGTNRVLPHDRKDEFIYNRLLSWEEIEEMHSNGVTFCSHSLNHANLGGLEPEKLKEEIKESKEVLENKLGAEVQAISYPFGLISDFNEGTIIELKKAGYNCAFTAMYGINSKRSDIYKLRRIGIEASDNMFTFKAKLNGALDLMILKETRFVQTIVKFVNRILGS